MATSKTLTPTNVTIQIPEFTDQPDQRVNSNCIDKLGDAVNTLNINLASLMVQTAQFSIAPNSYTDIDYPTGYTRGNTRVLSAVVAYYYVDFSNLTVQLTDSKIRVFNGTAQNWGGVQLVLAKFA